MSVREVYSRSAFNAVDITATDDPLCTTFASPVEDIQQFEFFDKLIVINNSDTDIFVFMNQSPGTLTAPDYVEAVPGRFYPLPHRSILEIEADSGVAFQFISVAVVPLQPDITAGSLFLRWAKTSDVAIPVKVMA